MNKILGYIIVAAITLSLAGCASMGDNANGGPDGVTRAFFDSLQRSDRQAAYGLLAKGLSQRISFSEFEDLMDTLEGQWGRLQEREEAFMPFHQRPGEERFIPLGLEGNQIKRYIFDVKFDHAQINWDLTLAPVQGQYKIVWFSFWGSEVYMKTEIRQKFEELFSGD